MYTTIMSFALEKSNNFNRHVFKKGIKIVQRIKLH